MNRKMMIGKLAAKAAAGVTAAFLICFASAAEERPVYLKSATYASDGWVINFWNMELDHLDEELAAIAADGFNSIVLAVPWSEFQPEMKPARYNDYAFRQLGRIMDCARRHGLWVQLRVSYTWDYYDGNNCQVRFRQILGDEDVRRAWTEYVGKVYQEASAHGNLYGGFITWEDFWNYVEDSVYWGTGEFSVGEARRIGYQDYLREHYSLEDLNRYYHPAKRFTDYAMVYVPPKDSPARKLFYEFYDDKLNGLLRDAQQVFPGISMEVRLDVDPVEAVGGEGKIGADHNVTFPCGDAAYTSLMYSVSMGQLAYQELSASEALVTMGELLEKVRAYSGGKPIYIDQLLYMDETEGFSHNAKLREEERSGYLVSLPPILKAYTNGYAVWSYHNYTNNPLFNSQFALDGRGWNTNRVSFVSRGGSRMARLEASGKLSQDCSRITGQGSHDNHVRFTADSDREVTLTVSLGSQQKRVRVNGRQDFDLDFGRLGYQDVAFSSDGEVFLDNVQVYNFIQDGQLYDIDGNELSCIEAVRTLNASLGD